jgi:transcriptional regulator with XRE-family HTH domain
MSLRSHAYVGFVPAKKELAREPSALVNALLDRITKLRKERGIKLNRHMKQAGATQQSWSRWKHGASPGIDLLEAVVRALDAELVVEVRDRRAAKPYQLPQATTPEAVEIVGAVDVLSDPDARQRIRDQVFAMVAVLKGKPDSAALRAAKPSRKAK